MRDGGRPARRLVNAAGENILDHLDPQALHDPPQHRRMLHRRRGGPRRPARPRAPAGSRQSWQRVGEARGPRRHAHAPPRSDWHARSHPPARRRGLCGPRLHQRRSRRCPPPQGGRGGERDAGREPNRLRPGDSQSQRPADLSGVSQGGRSRLSGHRRCRGRHGQRRRRGDGLGVDGVLLNTAIAHATDPVRMAAAMQAACYAGRQAFLAGRIPRRLYATASSPDEGRIGHSAGG